MMNLSLFRRMKNILLGQSGMALPAVLLVMVVLVVLGVAILSTTLAEANFAIEQNQKTQAHYLGRSGVLLGYEKVKLMTQNPLDYGYDGTIDELVTALNSWAAANAGTMHLDTKNEFDLSYELINNNELKIRSLGEVNGLRVTNDTVTLRVRMLRSLLNGGRADVWYNGNGLTLDHKTDSTDEDETYIGKGVYLTGKDSQSTKFPSNSGNPIFQASIIQFLSDLSNTCLEYSGNTAETTFDAEVILFSGNVKMDKPTKQDNLYLIVSDEVAEDKVNNSSSTLYITDGYVRASIDLTLGFADLVYHEYFSGEEFLFEATSNPTGHVYPFEPSIRYGVVQFERPLLYNGAVAITADYYYFPNGVNLRDKAYVDASEFNTDDLIPIDSDDPIIDRIKAINRVTVDTSTPYMWDNK